MPGTLRVLTIRRMFAFSHLKYAVEIHKRNIQRAYIENEAHTDIVVILISHLVLQEILTLQRRDRMGTVN